MRTCVACKANRAKRELVRVVRTTDGAVVVDVTGKQSGRGAYLCRQKPCWDEGLRRGILERALKQPVPVECRPALEAFARSLPEKLDSTAGKESSAS
ncbi:MAG TPA: YlxR family protein [Chloroflexota bacterium]|nr:YlxR family protein [Chloroflexota bacterium]